LESKSKERIIMSTQFRPANKDPNLEDPESRSGTEKLTDRAQQREREEEHFVPVIIKRTDEARRHPDDVLEMAIFEGLEQLKRRPYSLWLSAIAAGMILAFTAMAVAVLSTVMQSIDASLVQRLGTALVYPLGFVICLMSGTELFTEHTATAVYPVLDRRASPVRLVRLWVVVISGNLIGAFAGALLLTFSDEVIQARAGYIAIGEHLTSYTNIPLLLSSILAGWLMAMGAWLIVATPPSSSQIISIYIVTFLIGLGGLHHSIAGSVEMFTALMLGDHFTIYEAARFIGVALAGNLVGGSVFVGLLNYGHIRETQTTE
jgi:formate/nitrite transporter FocA (FNT family)